MDKTGPLQRFFSRVFDGAALVPCGIDRDLQIQVEQIQVEQIQVEQIQVEPGRLQFCRREWLGREHDRRDLFFRAVEIIATAPVVVTEAIPGVFA